MRACARRGGPEVLPRRTSASRSVRAHRNDAWNRTHFVCELYGLPASGTDLAAGLAEVDEKALAHLGFL